jgi:uncharacterized membrane protein
MTPASNDHDPSERAHLLPDAGERVRAAELLISRLLRTGVMASLVLIIGGVLLSFLHHPDYVSSPSELQRLTRPGAAFPHTLRDVLIGLREWQGRAVTTVGLLLLIATPVIRVAVSILMFAHERDWLFVAITSVVLLLLLTSFLLGKAGG